MGGMIIWEKKKKKRPKKKEKKRPILAMDSAGGSSHNYRLVVHSDECESGPLAGGLDQWTRQHSCSLDETPPARDVKVRGPAMDTEKEGLLFKKDNMPWTFWSKSNAPAFVQTASLGQERRPCTTSTRVELSSHPRRHPSRQRMYKVTLTRRVSTRTKMAQSSSSPSITAANVQRHSVKKTQRTERPPESIL